MNSLPDRRAELLDKIVDALLTEGVADLSLRPLAERVGTSARLLIYHFETRDNLIASALAEVRLRADQALRRLAARETPDSLGASLLMFWDWATAEPNQRYFRLLFEVDGLSMFDRLRFSRETRQDGAAAWLALIERAAARTPGERVLPPGLSTLILGALNGLLQDFLSTGDRARTTAALVDLIELLDAAAREHQRQIAASEA